VRREEPAFRVALEHWLLLGWRLEGTWANQSKLRVISPVWDNFSMREQLRIAFGMVEG
jgi:hypothetical protein